MKSVAASLKLESGHSIFEVLIAAFIIAIGIIAVSGVFLMNLQENAVAEDVTKAAVLAQDKLEELATLPYGALIAGGDGGSLTTSLAGYFDAPEPDYLRRWQIDVDAPLAELTIVRVRVVAARQLIGAAKECTLVLSRTR